jgi:hypothetical protein
MTHTVDCKVKSEFRDRITELAEEVYEQGDFDALQQFADEHDWVNIGSGAARTAYKVSEGDPDADDVVKSSPCVIKFATSGFSERDGVIQNRQEIRQYERYEGPLTGEVPGYTEPVFVPLKDWGPDKRWISLPYAGGRGNASEVRERALEEGVVCRDVKSDNVAGMHGESVLLDYGVDCNDIDVANELAELEQSLERIGLRNINTIEEGPGQGAIRVTAKFELPEFLSFDAPGVQESSLNAHVEPARGGMSGLEITEIHLFAGFWWGDRNIEAELNDAARELRLWADNARREVNDTWHVVGEIDALPKDPADTVFELELQFYDLGAYDRGMPPGLAKTFLENLLFEMDNKLPPSKAKQRMNDALDRVETIDPDNFADTLIESDKDMDDLLADFEGIEGRSAGRAALREIVEEGSDD